MGNNINNNMNNNVNNNEKGNNINNNNANLDNNNKSNIILTFTFESYDKQIVSEVNENETFENIIKDLEEKYFWFGYMQNKSYFYQKEQITNFNLSIKELNIVDKSNIIIKI